MTDKNSNKNFDFDFALSYAGEDKKIVDEIANELKKRNVKHFYFEYEEHIIWGKDLFEYLAGVFKDRARFSIVFVSTHYASKPYTMHEFRSASSQKLITGNDNILPIRIDDSDVPGLLPSIYYLDINKYSVTEICDMIEKRINYENALLDRSRVNIQNEQTLAVESDTSINLNYLDPIAIEDFLYVEQKGLESLLGKSELYPNELPGIERMTFILSTLEEYARSLIGKLAKLTKNNDPQLNDALVDFMSNLAKYKYSDTSGYQYIWISLSRYLLLLVFYSLAIISLKNRNYALLTKLLNLKFTETIGYNFNEYEFKVFQLVNPYHLFNEVNGLIMHTYEYIPTKSEVALARPWLVANLRIYNVLKELLNSEFVDEQQFAEYFDLFEFLLGLLFIEIRIDRGDDEPFGLYGLNFRKYSNRIDDLLKTNTAVGKFLQREIESQDSAFLKAGFFEGERKKFVDVLTAYLKFLRSIR